MSPDDIPRPGPGEYAPFYAGYVDAVPDGGLGAVLRAQRAEVAALLAGLDDAAAGFRYAPDRWSVKEVVGHVTDAERVFAYRLLRFARGDRTPLPGFDENRYAAQAGADRRPVAELAAEHDAVRAATLALLGSLAPDVLRRDGEASGHRMSVRALAWVIAGHERHHLRVLRERYLPHVHGG